MTASAPHAHRHHAHDHAHHGHADADDPAQPLTLRLYSPAGVLLQAASLRRAAERLGELGFAVSTDPDATRKVQRFAGDDATRLAALHRTADARPDVALASRGGYGMTRLLDAIDWKRVEKSVAAGTRWVGHSDLTCLHLGLLAHRGGGITWAGPLARDDFDKPSAAEVDDVTAGCFVEAMRGELEGIGFQAEAGFDGLSTKGLLWGGNLSIVCSLLGTRHLPAIKGGLLFLEDVNEHPYRVERCLLQLAQAGVLGAQKAVLLGAFSGWKKSPNDRGYTLKSAIARVREAVRTPIVGGLPFGHVPTLVTLPVGATARLVVDGRAAWLGWHEH